MSPVRPVEPDDMAEVAALYQRVFRDKGRQATPALETCLRRHYLEAPGCDPDIRPLVHLGPTGSISAFIGVNALPMIFEERRLRAAVCGSLMSDPKANDPMAVPLLLRACLAGPQDLSVSETASDVSRQMWTRLRGIALPQYSLDWTRIIRPLGFALELAKGRMSATRLLAPFANNLDRRMRKRIRAQELRWSAVPDNLTVKGGLDAVETDPTSFAGQLTRLLDQFPLRPAWSDAELAHVLAEAGKERDFGRAVFALVQAAGGTPIGAFVYHIRPGTIARVLQIVAQPDHAGAVLDCLIRDAAKRGAVGLRGRAQPFLLEAMLGRRIAFTHASSTVVHSRDPAILDAFRHGRAFTNGLAGESWSVLIGGRLD